MARLPLYVILLMISVTMVIKLMPVSAFKEKRKSMIKMIGFGHGNMILKAITMKPTARAARISD